MTDEQTEVRVWSCPICGEGIDVRLQWRAKGVGLVKVLHVDDMDARLHMAWHQMCTCRWEPLPPEKPQAILRHPDIDCPVH